MDAVSEAAVNTTNRRKIKECLMYVGSLLLWGWWVPESQVAAQILHMSDLTGVSVDCLHVLQPARYPATTPALTTPLATTSPLLSRTFIYLFLSRLRPLLVSALVLFVRFVRCCLFQFRLLPHPTSRICS